MSGTKSKNNYYPQHHVNCMNCGSMIMDIFVIIVNEYLYNRVPKGGNMKQCRKNCGAWLGLADATAITNTTRGLYQWTHCPYCDSGKLVDKDAELREEFWSDTCAAWHLSYAYHQRDNYLDKIFNKYNITKKE